jgi:2-methylcitrate dehydratase
MGMHFKLGLYEHQSAGALQGLINIISRHPHLLDDQSGDNIKSIKVRAYEPAFGIIGDPAKRDPKTRQSADHSMLYLVCTMLRKALELHAAKKGAKLGWKELMLRPHDFDAKALHDRSRAHSWKMTFEHGGAEYDAKYPDGIPTSIIFTDDKGESFDSGLVMYPGGHARNDPWAPTRSISRTSSTTSGRRSANSRPTIPRRSSSRSARSRRSPPRTSRASTTL